MGQSMTYMLGIRSLADADVNLAVRRGSFSLAAAFRQLYAADGAPRRGFIRSTWRRSGHMSRRRCGWHRNFSAIPAVFRGLSSACARGADAEQVRQALARLSGDDYRVRTRHELRASFYRIMTYEKWGIFFISLLVLVIASFSVVGALAMLIVDKRRDIVTPACAGSRHVARAGYFPQRRVAHLRPRRCVRGRCWASG